MMKDSTAGRLLLGIVTLLPLAYMAGFMWMVLSSIRTEVPPFDVDQFHVLFAMHLGMMALVFGLLVFYIVHLFRTSAIRNDMKALWAVVLFFGNMPAMIVYWYLYVWRNRPRGNPTIAG